MKKILTFLIILVLLVFTASAFYVFEIPPFNPGGPFIPPEIPETIDEEEVSIPETGVARPNSYEDHLNKAALLKQNGYNALAITEYQAAARMDPAKITPLIQTGIIYLEENDYLKAKVSFEEALKIKPDNLTTKIYLVKTLIAQRELIEADKIIISIRVHNQESKYYQALLRAYFGDHAKAKSLLNEVINLNSTSEIAENAGKYLAAYDEFDFNLGGQNTHLKTLLGRTYAQTGEYQLAIAILFDAIKEKKNYRDPWIILGYSYLNINKFPDAIEALEEAKKLDPQHPKTPFYLAIAYQGIGDLDRAIQNLELARNNGYEPRIQIEQKLSEIYLQQKEYEKAAQSYENLIALNNEDINQFIKPIWIYIDRLNQPFKALELANKALAAHPEDPMGFNLVGWASVGADDFENARKYLDKALSLNPKLDAVYLNYGTYYEKQGNYKEAAKYYKAAYNLGNGNSISAAAADKYNNIIGKTSGFDYATVKADVLNTN
jgi:tetratricopeptide (TPR) repeat protein